jgi:glycogen(starch) synthase
MERSLTVQDTYTESEDLEEPVIVDDGKPKPLLFEVCWELAKKVGGIYTVIRSKALITSLKYKEKYILIGPYNSKTQFTEFEFTQPTGSLAKVLEILEKEHKIKYRFGRWLVKGSPRVVLLDFDSSRDKLHEWRTAVNPYLSPHDSEVNDAIIFGNQMALFLAGMVKNEPKEKLIAHFHEWMCGVAIVLLRTWQIKISTIFTTHATILGRFLSAGKVDFYRNIERVNVEQEAGDRGIYAKYWIERAAAHGAHLFTTISEITAHEATFMLGKKPDHLLPNGLQVEHFEALHEFQTLHAESKAIISDFVKGHFYGHYNFDLDKTLYFFTSGRYEVFNKGIDMYIEALSQLNELLKQEQTDVTVVAFIITNGNANGFNNESLRGREISRDLKKTCENIVKHMADRMFEAACRGEIVKPEQLMDDDDLVKLKGSVLHVNSRATLPPIVTHNMLLDDEIINLLKQYNLLNLDHDRVKVIYHPEFLTRLNPLIPLDYTQFVRGCHLGVFPSYYEPWGYTPAECTVMGVPSITSNFTGFANFMSRRVEDPERHGIFIIDRQHKSYHEAVTQTTNTMWRFCQLSRRARINMRNKTERLSKLLSWNILNQYYENARQASLTKVYTEEGK